MRKELRASFTHVPNEIIRDPDVSPQARLLLILMLSFPDDWVFSMEHLRVTYLRVGKHAARAALAELMAIGYVSRQPRQEDDGRMHGHTYIVRDHRAATQAPPPKSGFPTVGEPPTPKSGFSIIGEPQPTKTERSTKTERPKILEPKITTSVGKADEGVQAESAKAEARAAVEAVRATWNARCGALAKSRNGSAEIEKKIRALQKRHGAALPEMFASGIAAVRDDPYWLGSKAPERSRRRDGAPYGLINYLRHVEGKADMAAGSPQIAVAGLQAPQVGESWYLADGHATVVQNEQAGYVRVRLDFVVNSTPGRRIGDTIEVDVQQLRRKRMAP